MFFALGTVLPQANILAALTSECQGSTKTYRRISKRSVDSEQAGSEYQCRSTLFGRMEEIDMRRVVMGVAVACMCGAFLLAPTTDSPQHRARITVLAPDR